MLIPMTKFNGKEVAESLDQPKRLLEHVFKSLALKGKQFEIFQAASNEKIYVYKEVLLPKFDDNIFSLSLRNDFMKTKYPKIFDFYNKHCVSRAYHLHIFKCSDADCPWHEPIRLEKLLILGSLYHQKLLMVQLNISLAQIPLKNFSHQSLRILANILMGYCLHLLHKLQ